MTTVCPGRLCQKSVVSQTNMPGTPTCLYKTYLCMDCDSGVWVNHDASCSFPVPRLCSNSADCASCIKKPPTPPIPPAYSTATSVKDESAVPEDQYPRYVDAKLLEEGLPAKPDLVPGDEYDVEERTVNGTRKKGISFNMQLLDQDQNPIGRAVLVHLDWFVPKHLHSHGTHKKVGTGYQTVDEEDESPEYQSIRYSECVYAVYLKQGSKWRFYVVFLPKEGAAKK